MTSKVIKALARLILTFLAGLFRQWQLEQKAAEADRLKQEQDLNEKARQIEDAAHAEILRNRPGSVADRVRDEL